MAKAGSTKSKEESRSEVNLEQVTLRAHPDLLRAVEKKAAADGRKKNDVLRDLLAKGAKADGLYF